MCSFSWLLHVAAGYSAQRSCLCWVCSRLSLGHLGLSKSREAICSTCIYLQCQALLLFLLPSSRLEFTFEGAKILYQGLKFGNSYLPGCSRPSCTVPALWCLGGVEPPQGVVGSTAGPGLGDCTGEALSLARTVMRFCSL